MKRPGPGAGRGHRPAALPSRSAGRLPGRLVPGAIVLLALLLRVWVYRHQQWVTVDGTEYILFAEALARGEAFRSIFPPGYPLLVALARFLVADRVAAAAAVSIVAGALLPWPVWALSRRAVGRWAWLPALLVALHPGLVKLSAVTMSDSAYFLSLFGALALAAARPWAAGLLLGAGFAIRPEALLPAAVLGLAGLVAVRRGSLRPRARAAAAGAFRLLAAASGRWFRAPPGEWTLTPKTTALASVEDWRQTESRLGTATAPEAMGLVERLRRHGPEALRRYPERALLHGRALLVEWPIPVLLLSLLGLLRRRGLEAVPLLHVLAIPLLAVSAQPRFVLGAVPALAIAAVVPFARARRGLWLGLLALLGVAGVAWRATSAARGMEWATTFEAYLGAERDAGRWLSGVSEPGDRVMDRKPAVAFYANRPYRVMPDWPYEEIVEYARREDVRYLVLEEGVVRIFRPQLVPLLYDADFRARERRLEMVYFGGHHRGYGVVVFRVLRPGEALSGRPPVADLRWRRSAPPPGSMTPRALP